MGLDRATSARTALAVSLSTLLRLFAPVMPFVTEEIWSWWQEGSVHQAPWPEPSDASGGPSATGATVSAAADGTGAVYTSAVDLLAAIRRAKSEARVGPRSPVERVTVSGPRSRFPRSAWSKMTSAPPKMWANLCSVLRATANRLRSR